LFAGFLDQSFSSWHRPLFSPLSARKRALVIFLISYKTFVSEFFAETLTCLTRHPHAVFPPSPRVHYSSSHFFSRGLTSLWRWTRTGVPRGLFTFSFFFSSSVFFMAPADRDLRRIGAPFNVFHVLPFWMTLDPFPGGASVPCPDFSPERVFGSFLVFLSSSLRRISQLNGCFDPPAGIVTSVASYPLVESLLIDKAFLYVEIRFSLPGKTRNPSIPVMESPAQVIFPFRVVLKVGLVTLILRFFSLYSGSSLLKKELLFETPLPPPPHPWYFILFLLLSSFCLNLTSPTFKFLVGILPNDHPPPQLDDSLQLSRVSNDLTLLTSFLFFSGGVVDSPLFPPFSHLQLFHAEVSNADLRPF